MMSNSLLNRKAIKKYIKAKFEQDRPHLGITRVSQQAVDEIEAFLKLKIAQSIHTHPSGGKTFLHFQ